jgi:hypothetical protein
MRYKIISPALVFVWFGDEVVILFAAAMPLGAHPMMKRNPLLLNAPLPAAPTVAKGSTLPMMGVG